MVIDMNRIHFDNQNGYSSLAECVVLQAVKAYIRSYRVFLRNPYNMAAEQMMEECESFIESEWFRKLCDLDPEELLYRIEKEVEHGYYCKMKPEDVDNMLIGKRIVEAIDDYVIWYRIFLKDPTDEDAIAMMEDCEEFLIRDPKVRYYIRDPEKFLYELDKDIEEEFAGGLYDSDK